MSGDITFCSVQLVLVSQFLPGVIICCAAPGPSITAITLIHLKVLMPLLPTLLLFPYFVSFPILKNWNYTHLELRFLGQVCQIMLTMTIKAIVTCPAKVTFLSQTQKPILLHKSLTGRAGAGGRPNWSIAHRAQGPLAPVPALQPPDGPAPTSPCH